MSLSTGQDQGLRAARNQFQGAVGSEGLNSLLEAMKRLLGNEVSLPDVSVARFVAASSTAQVVFGGACKLYGIRVESGNALTSTLACLVDCLDNTLAISRVKCNSEKAVESYVFGSDQGVGVDVLVSLNVKAFAIADGTSAPAAGDKPIVTVFYGA